MKLMSTYEAQVEMDGGTTQRSVSAENGRAMVTKTFKYIEPFYNYFKCRHQVDDHNTIRHSPISLEESSSFGVHLSIPAVVLSSFSVQDALKCVVFFSEVLEMSFIPYHHGLPTS